MSGIKGFSSSLKHIKAPKAHPTAKTEQQFATVSPSGYDKHGLDVVLKAQYPITNSPTTIDVVQPTEDADRVIKFTNHGLRQGDIVRFSEGSSLEGIESEIIEIPDADTLVLATKLPSVPVAGVDTVELLRGITARASANGGLETSLGPIQFLKDRNDGNGPVTTTVSVNATTPANSDPLPVEIISTDGTPATFNLTAGDINVSLNHIDNSVPTAYDSVRIGDGTNLASIDVTGRLQVQDVDVEATLTSIDTKVATETTLEASRVLLASIDGKDFATQTTLASLEAKDFATQTTLASLEAKDFATQTTLAAVDTKLGSIDGKDFATQTTLASLEAKDFATQTTLASLEAKDFATQTTLALIEGKDFATQTTLASLEAKDFATQTTLASLEAKDFATQTTLASLEAKDFATQTTLNSVLTELQAKADLTETQPVKIVANDGLTASRGLTIASTIVTLSVPAGANKVHLQASVANTDTIYIGSNNGLLDETNGWELLPGASVEFETGVAVAYYSLTGGDRLNFIWSTRS